MSVRYTLLFYLPKKSDCSGVWRWRGEEEEEEEMWLSLGKVTFPLSKTAEKELFALCDFLWGFSVAANRSSCLAAAALLQQFLRCR